MCSGAEKFNQDIGLWNKSKVTSMEGIFYQAAELNQDIGMEGMCSGAEKFNQGIGRWNTIQDDDYGWGS